ncbi:MAG: hypothetical protein H0W90_08645 [Actinobacteria bacterium]|nr:hypothetical protein [Actinomycetota bacterium]
MSNISLFAVGVVVTLLVLAALALLFWGAILDGRDENEQRVAAEDAATQARQDLALHAIDAA